MAEQGARRELELGGGASGGNGDKESSETNIKSRNRCDRPGQSVFSSRDPIRAIEDSTCIRIIASRVLGFSARETAVSGN